MAGRPRLFNDEKKWCPGCRDWIPLSNFGNCKRMPSGKRSRCKKCFKEQNAPHMQKYLYGLSDRHRQELWDKQNKCCAICHEPISIIKRTDSYLDYDRITKEVRGLLCHRCSLGLRNFQESQMLLAEAVKYLNRFDIARKQRKKGVKTCSYPASRRQRAGESSGHDASNASCPKTTPSSNG